MVVRCEALGDVSAPTDLHGLSPHWCFGVWSDVCFGGVSQCSAMLGGAWRCLAVLGNALDLAFLSFASSHAPSSRHQNNSTRAIVGFPCNPRASCWHVSRNSASPSHSLVSSRSFTGASHNTSIPSVQLFHYYGAVFMLRDGTTNTLTMPY